MKKYDLAIIGSGPGGYVAAIYASRHKFNTCIVEKNLVGGTCLNKGCIPTKALLNSASLISVIKEAPSYGIDIGSYQLNFARIISRKDEVVSRLRAGVETLLKANKVELMRGAAEFISKDTIRVGGKEDISAKNFIIASGSAVSGLAGIEIDESKVLSSDGILDIRSIPSSLAIIGGGVIGCEFATLFNALGSKVSIIESTERIISNQSREASRKLEMIFKRRGIEVLTSATVEEVVKSSPLKLKLSAGKTLESEKILVSVGRVPNTKGLGLEKAQVKTDKGRIVVNEYLQANVSGIYAIGDCVGAPLLAHKASYDAMAACDNIRGEPRKADYSNIPSCIWTDPEIASVGMTEEEAKAKHPDAKIAKFPYLGSGKAFIEGKTEGFVKIIGDSSGRILGVEILGKGACDLISEAVLARTMRINIRDWARSVHGHPTLSEVLQEAAHIFCGSGIHAV